MNVLHVLKLHLRLELGSGLPIIGIFSLKGAQWLAESTDFIRLGFTESIDQCSPDAVISHIDINGQCTMKTRASKFAMNGLILSRLPNGLLIADTQTNSPLTA